MSNFSSKIIKIKGFSDLISKSSGRRHGFKFQIHGGSRFNVTKFKVSPCLSTISIEKFINLIIIFWEFCTISKSLFEFTIIIQNVDSFFIKKFSYFAVLVYHISQISFFEIRVKSLVSDSNI